MVTRRDQLSRTVSRFAMGIAAIVALCLPAGFFGLSYQYQVGAMRAEAQYGAAQATRYVALNPEMWRFQVPRLRTLIVDDDAETDLPEQRRIVDASGHVLIESENQLDSPVLSTRVPLYDAGRIVGYLEVSRSFRPLLLEPVWKRAETLAMASCWHFDTHMNFRTGTESVKVTSKKGPLRPSLPPSAAPSPQS